MVYGFREIIKNQFEQLGKPIIITNRYQLAANVPLGSTELPLIDSFGLTTGKIIQIGVDQYEIRGLNGDTLIISESINLYTEGQLVFCIETGYGKETPAYKRVTQEILEYTRKVLVPYDMTVNYGARVSFDDREFFLIGLYQQLNTKELKIKEINKHIKITRGVEVEATYDDFDNTIKETTIASDIPAFVSTVLGRVDFGDVGYTPNTLMNVLIESHHPVELMDRVYVDNRSFKVVGIDLDVIKNLQLLTVDYDTSRGAF